MQGLWKESLSGWNHKNSYRKKTTRKNTLRDKARVILQDYKKKSITKTENAQIITYTGSRWGRVFPLPKTANIYKISYRIPKKNDEYDELKGSYVTIKAYYKGSSYNGKWYEADTNKSIKDYHDLTFLQNILILNIYVNEEVIGNKVLDWSEEIENRKKVYIQDFHTTQREFVYNLPLPYLKLYTKSTRRKWAHRYVTGKTRASVRSWIDCGDWDAERTIPWGEISYAWIID